jgi:hypothetical protein
MEQNFGSKASKSSVTSSPELQAELMELISIEGSVHSLSTDRGKTIVNGEECASRLS